MPYFNWDIAFRESSWDIRLVMLGIKVTDVLGLYNVKSQHSRETQIA